MEKEVINYIIDILLLISLIAVGITGIIKLNFILPLIGLTWQSPATKILSKIHDYSGIALTLLVLLHLILHWNWIIEVTKNIFKSSTPETD